jgi:hypothetical protein
MFRKPRNVGAPGENWNTPGREFPLRRVVASANKGSFDFVRLRLTSLRMTEFGADDRD